MQYSLVVFPPHLEYVCPLIVLSQVFRQYLHLEYAVVRCARSWHIVVTVVFNSVESEF